MGHLTRSKVLLREINETYTSNVKLYVLGKKINFKNSIYKNKIKFISKLSNKLFNSSQKILIDLPLSYLKKIKNKNLNKENIIIIDIHKDLRNPKFIIPSIRKFKLKNKNIFSGKDFLILSRNILKEKFKRLNSKKDLMFLSGSGVLSNLQLEILKKIKKY